MNFQEELEVKIRKIENIMRQKLPPVKGNQSVIFQAMQYSVMAGGKRIRPLLMKEVYDAYNGESDAIESFMLAIELIHTYSLVHDDLPAMDDDRYRRGRETTHIVYGEDMGILAGDALLNYSFELMTSTYDLENIALDKIIEAMRVISNKSGSYGMIGGQVIDVTMTGKELTLELLEEIFALKTSALIEASLMVGAILANASSDKISLMEIVGSKVGLAFQIQDDILDVLGDEEVMGKPVQSDIKNGKTTYVDLVGIQKAKEKVKELSVEAIELLDKEDVDMEFLKNVINMLIYRKK